MTRIALFLSMVTTTSLFAQVSLDFESEALDTSPAIFSPPWSGDTHFFTLTDDGDNKQLRSNAGDLDAAFDYYISIPSTAISDFSWEFFIDLQFNPSGANYVDVFLVSDQADLNLVQNGYYVRLGDTQDWIALHKIVDGTRTDDAAPLIGTETGLLAGSGSKPYKIRVVRDGEGNWELLVDAAESGNFTSIGVVFDIDVVASSYFGISIAQSAAASPANSHFFDNILIADNDAPDVNPPEIQSLTVVSSTALEIKFSEEVDESASQMINSYVIGGGIEVLEAVRNEMDHSLVHLTINPLENGSAYQITISNVADNSGNVMVTDIEHFEYLVTEEAVFGDVVVNEFCASPTDESLIPNSEFVELLNVSDKFIDLTEWTFSDATGTSGAFAATILRPGEYLILAPSGNGDPFTSYGDVLEVSGFRSLNNSGDEITVSSPLEPIVFTTTYFESSSGVTTELINPNGPDYSSNNYGLSIHPGGGTPGAQNSIFDNTPDTTAPEIEALEVVSPTSLEVSFSEFVELETSQDVSNYLIDGDITVLNALRSAEDFNIVYLTVSALVSGEVRTLTIIGIEDLSGNATVADASIDFEYIETEEAEFGDIVINEFHSRPDDSSIIPNVEFIELLNISGKFIDVENWTFSDATATSGLFPSKVIRPNEYLILTAVGNESLLEGLGEVVEIPGFRGLNSNGDSIILSNPLAETVFAISYTNASSGITTELINPFGPDFSENNYGLSTAMEGGTPGAQNSIFDDRPDTIAPEIVRIEVISSTELEVSFSETVTTESSQALVNYTIDGGITVLDALRTAENNSIVHLTVSGLVSGVIRTLMVTGVEDLSGNEIATNSTIQFEYIETEESEMGDVVINEFYATPSLESLIPGVEYVELLNISSKFIELENWTLNDASNSSSGFGSHVLRPDEYVILTESDNGDLFTEYGQVLEVSGFPALNNNGDEISIIAGTGLQIHNLTYSGSIAGQSIELINPFGPDFSENNYGLSTAFEGGTPGAQNSIFDDTPDITAPEIVRIEVISSTELEVSFSETVTAESSQALVNYTIDDGITVLDALRNVEDNSVVHLTVSGLVSGVIRTLMVTGVEDLSGNEIATNSTIQFEYIETEESEMGDVVINEFYATPSLESLIPAVEYVELLNISSKFIELENWTLNDASNSSSGFGSYVLRPNEYVILTELDNGHLFTEYGQVLEVSGFPALNNNGDEISIIAGTGLQIHNLTYSGSIAGQSIELINPFGPDFSENNYGLSTAMEGGTPGAQNSIFDDTPDTIAPEIVRIEVISSTDLEIYFSETITTESSQAVVNYSIDGGISVLETLRNVEDNSIVHLTVSGLVSGAIRTLVVTDVEDLSGNEIIPNSTIQFEYIETEESEMGDVVINEFYATPSLESLIPAVEYVELLNISSKFIELENWTLNDASNSSSGFGSYVLRPDEYVILTESDNGHLFTEYGQVLEVSGFPALNNNGDEIGIINGSGLEIHSISYSGSIAGQSIELINPFGSDFSENNYGLSTAMEGGTPGAQNSIFDDTPDTIAPFISSIEVRSSTELEVIFSEAVSQLSAEEAGNYSIDGGIAVQSALQDPLMRNVIRLSTSLMISTEQQILTVNHVEDLSGNMIATGSTVDFVYIATQKAEPGDIVINEFLAKPINSSDDFVELFNRSEKYLDMAGWKLSDESSSTPQFDNFIFAPNTLVVIYDEGATRNYSAVENAISVPILTLNNANDQIEMVDAEGSSLVFLSYSTQPDAGVSSELINPNDPCISENSYAASVDQSGNSAGLPNSVFDDSPDLVSPVITTFQLEGSLMINFSEIMEESSLINGSYTATGLTISEVSTRVFPTAVELEFLENLEEGTIYELTISGLTDCSGNAMQETTVRFGLGRAPFFNEVLITEINYDPDPAVGLPNVEFVEIYNNTSELISTRGLHFSDATSTIPLPLLNLKPNEYYVMTAPNAALEFPDINVLGVSGFPSLANNGEQLSIHGGNGLIFSISYQPQWHDEEKSEGGYTLEMKDILNPCVEDANWGSSIQANGGTPGFKNSILASIPDNFGPQVVNVLAISPDTVRVDFDERIDPISEVLGKVELSPSIAISSLLFSQSFPKSIFVVLSENLTPSVAHLLEIMYVTDCNGKEVQPHEVVFALPEPPQIGEVLLSEVLFNPRSGGVDFVEVHNPTSKYFSLMDWRLARIKEEGISDEKIISSEELVLVPGEFIAFTEDPSRVLSDYPRAMAANLFEVGSLPTYANDTGNVVLLNEQGVTFQHFYYEDDYHFDLLESTDGVSLERISYDVEVNNKNNWRSASSMVGLATPGYKNSQSRTIENVKNHIVATPKIFLPGNSGSGRDFTTINYQFDQPGKFANIMIYDQTGRIVKSLAEGELLATTGFVRWDGTTNTGGLARLGYYVVLFEVYDSSGKTELLKETIVVGRDF